MEIRGPILRLILTILRVATGSFIATTAIRAVGIPACSSTPSVVTRQKLPVLPVSVLPVQDPDLAHDGIINTGLPWSVCEVSPHNPKTYNHQVVLKRWGYQWAIQEPRGFSRTLLNRVTKISFAEKNKGALLINQEKRRKSVLLDYYWGFGIKRICPHC